MIELLWLLLSLKMNVSKGKESITTKTANQRIPRLLTYQPFGNGLWRSRKEPKRASSTQKGKTSCDDNLNGSPRVYQIIVGQVLAEFTCLHTLFPWPDVAEREYCYWEVELECI